MGFIRTNAIRILKTSTLFGLMFFVFSCASYHDRITEYYKNVEAHDWKAADASLEKNALLKKPRNKLLFLMEKGRIAHLAKEYQISNQYFNEADQLYEVGLKNAGDAIVGAVLNPMSQNYKGEDFEIFMLHYYKALNYLYLGNTEAAIVEARRITLQTKLQGDKYNEKSSRYSKDAFSLILQGLIYETDKDYNNAFIAYRNAVEVFDGAKNGVYYGVVIPENLKYDVMRMAYKMGFTSELRKFEKQFNTTFKDYEVTSGGELVLFWENGVAPIKRQEDLFFTLVKGDNGSLFFTDAIGGIMIPFDFGFAGSANMRDVHSLRIAMPKYEAQNPLYRTGKVSNQGQTFSFEKVEDVNELAIQTLNERSGKEMGEILTRVAVKKAAEYALTSSAKSSDGKNNAVLEGLGLGVQLFSMFSEKADTRNWQTLPGQINYVRIPLHKGLNEIVLTLVQSNGKEVQETLEIDGQGGLKFYNYTTLR